MGTGYRLRLAGVVIIAASLVACTSSSSSAQGDSTTSSIVERPGIGTPIVDGLDVQPGSHLLGTAFPAPDSTDPGTRVALIAIDDDPVQVVGFYAQALTKLGYQFASATCGGDIEVQQTCEVPAYPDSIPSGAAYLQVVGPGAGPPEFATTIQLTIAPRRAAATSTGGSSLARVPGTIITADEAMKSNPVRAVPSVPAPGVGDPVAAKRIDGETDLTVVEGSELLAPAVPLNGGRAGWSAVAKVSGDPVEVANAYLHQRKWDNVNPARQSGKDRSTITASASVHGGPYVDLTLIPADSAGTAGSESGDGPWWMLITTTFD